MPPPKTQPDTRTLRAYSADIDWIDAVAEKSRVQRCVVIRAMREAAMKAMADGNFVHTVALAQPQSLASKPADDTSQ